MINIRPVSDLRNKYPEIEKTVLKDDENVYLTKNGYGAMVVMSLEKYAKMAEKLKSDSQKDGKNISNGLLDEVSLNTNEINIGNLINEEVLPKIKRKQDIE